MFEGLFNLLLVKKIGLAVLGLLPGSCAATLTQNRFGLNGLSTRRIRWGGLRRVDPVSREFGLDRGRPVDRYYIERFLQEHAADIRGRVMEIADNTYTRRFGGQRVTRSDVLHVKPGNPDATIVADLANADHLPSEQFDCIICTQTLMFISDVRAAVATLHRLLKPGGVLLVTAAGISQICRWDMDQWGDYWRFTSLSMKQLLEHAFGSENVQVEARGNVLSAVAFLHGLAVEDLRPDELDHFDRDYELVVMGRAVKANRA